ncbi:CYTH domain-containing protein [Bacillus benzoevorans]|uniref:Uncharacterized protein YjbK n=1 Tax=Bacillus benzoevorans TaxID=1456 RepID=A0A7X0HQ96_9BACI|nr:CYTH domain-containing protein [Bacillus benzoevorans]MBB6443556.1 uncharacterized protein YjbK [Bacillus benzoevorans]
MPQNIEIEFKNLLTESDFHILLKHFNVNESQFFIQENYYFDTPDFSLKQSGCALRIREKKSGFEMTLKQPHPDGLLETTEKLTNEKAQALLQGTPLPDGLIKEQLSHMKINAEQLLFFGSLVTERAEIEYQGGVMVFDSSTYLNMRDYELEYEVTDRAKGEAVFLQLLAELNIPIRKTKNKVKRFYERKMAQELQ